MSAWIEIIELKKTRRPSSVALLVSAWIEITAMVSESHRFIVALLVSAWIEIFNVPPLLDLLSWSHSL